MICFRLFQPQNRSKAAITGTYDVGRFYHLLHGHGVTSLFGLPETPKVFSRDEVVACHALLTKMRSTLEMEWKESCNRNNNKCVWDVETSRHRVYRDRRFQDYYDNKGKPLFIFDDRSPPPRADCRCDGCDPSAVARCQYHTLVPAVCQAIKQALVDDMRRYFQIVMNQCVRFDRQLESTVCGGNNSLHHCFYAYNPLTVELRDRGVHFNVLSVPDAVNGYVLNWLEKECGQQVADEVEYQVIPQCLAAYHWDHVK